MRRKPVFSTRAFSALILFFIFGFQTAFVQAQDVRGVVLGSSIDGDLPLSGAHVFWIGGDGGVITDAHGHFSLPGENVDDRRIVISHVGFEAETLDVPESRTLEILLTRPRASGEVEVTAKAPDTYVAPMVQKTEIITAEELEHAACCDLSGCFGTTSSVQAEAMDIITDTRQLSMLGLDGVYTQILVDDIPYLTTGLNTQLGVSFLPGPFIDRIAVSKGANSVLQGSESFSGLINVLLLESDENRPLLFNAFTNSFLEQQYNAYAMHTFGRSSALIAMQGIRHGKRSDRNNDGFLDAPLTDRYSILAKWKFNAEENGVLSRTGVKYTWEDRLGGQASFHPDQHLGGSSVYGQFLQNRRLEIYDRTEFAVGDDQSVTFHLAGNLHQQDSWYGATLLQGRESTVYADAAYATPYMDEHVLTTGLSLRHTDMAMTIDLGSNPLAKTYAGTYDYLESVPGIFAENKSSFFDDDLTLIAGLRTDFRNDEGAVLTPRIFLRYALDEQTTLRASAGSAFRMARPFIERPAALGSWRDIRVQDDLEPERAINYGINLTRLYEAGPLSGTFSLDLYRTFFSRQVIAEYDDDPEIIFFRNLDGTSASDNILVEMTADVSPLSVRLSYTYADVYENRNDGSRRPLPFVSRHRVLAVLHATTADDAWQATLTTEWRDAQQLPQTAGYPASSQMTDQGDAYTLMHLHLQRSWESFDLYVGVENLFDYRQINPIINPDRPFESYFEPGFAWGPVKGREAYVGIRARINVI